MNILCTGGSGSLGIALANYYLLNPVDKYIVYSRGWHAQTALRNDLGNPDNFRWLIGDVRDRDRLHRACNGVDLIIHAAAIKDVVTCEAETNEAKKTNVDGTQNIIDAAIDNGVEKVMVISSDKAANPINSYGVSKAMCEKIAVDSNAQARNSKTTIAIARYGNVFNSSGSVVPLWKEQAKDGTLYITDKKMSRFWLTMGQAISFVLSSIEIMQPGAIYVPKLPSGRLVDLAKAIGPGCHVAEIGKRPGEKLAEVMVTEAESSHTKDCGSFYVIEPEFQLWDFESKGKPLPENFSYSSDNNNQWLSVEDIRELL